MKWDSQIAYLTGIIASDGNLSIDGRHIEITSKDLDLLESIKNILDRPYKITQKKSTYAPNNIYYRVQFSNVDLYRFLLSIGIGPHKSKTISILRVPNKYFADFLRGSFDGDGYTNSYWDKRWKSSYMLYTGFTSASKQHLEWIKQKILSLYQISGPIKYNGKSTYQLKYAKRASLILLQKMYDRPDLICLERKRSKVCESLGIIGTQAGVL